MKTKPRRIDFTQYDEDYECALLGAMGFSSYLIARKTGFSIGQINGRLRKANIRRQDFRNGNSTMAQSIIRNARPHVEGQLETHLRRQHVWTMNHKLK